MWYALRFQDPVQAEQYYNEQENPRVSSIRLLALNENKVAGIFLTFPFGNARVSSCSTLHLLWENIYIKRVKKLKNRITMLFSSMLSLLLIWK